LLGTKNNLESQKEDLEQEKSKISNPDTAHNSYIIALTAAAGGILFEEYFYGTDKKEEITKIAQLEEQQKLAQELNAALQVELNLLKQENFENKVNINLLLEEKKNEQKKNWRIWGKK
jgi:hypothetical protein